MDLIEATKSGFSNYFNFRDRAIRSEYWWWVVFQMILYPIPYFLMMQEAEAQTFGLFSILYTALGLALLIPSLSLSVRRLHDIDRSGWWLLIVFVPLVGVVLMLIWACTKGTDGPNRFGPDKLSSLS